MSWTEVCRELDRCSVSWTEVFCELDGGVP